MKTKLGSKFWLALTIFSLMGQVAWVVENMYFNVFIYKMFNATASDISNMVAASAITATLTTVFMGALSDKVGKRKLFMCSCYILWGVSIFSFIFLKEDIISKTFGMTVIEALSCGTQAIVYKDTACEEIVQKYGGVAVEPEADKVVEEIRNLIGV